MTDAIQQTPELIAIMNEAYKKGLSPAAVAIPIDARKYAKNESLWSEVSDSDLDTDGDDYANIQICNEVSGNLLDDFAINISNSIQFPLNTCFLHGLAVVASAMTRNFRYMYHGKESPVNLYVVTAQPPSTGKSGVNDYFSVPVRIAYEEVNAENKKIRSNLERRLEGVKSELKKATNERQAMSLTESMTQLEAEIAKYPHYIYATDDATPEALENLAFKQGGLFNIVSAESDAVNIMLGNVYSDKKTNHGVFLKGWDGEWHSPARITRETGSGPVFGSMAIIAQDESIRSILLAGMSGRGISERILMIRERNVLGKRDHTRYYPIDPVLKAEYAKLVSRLVKAEPTTFTFTDDAMEFLMASRCRIENELGDGGKYSHNMLRGAMGKADKQILKIACVLHAVDAYSSTGDQSTVIDQDTIIAAWSIFDQLSKTYIAAASSQGYAGEAAETIKMKQIFEMRASKGKLQFSIRALRDSIKATLPFSQIPHLTKQLREKILPTLCDDNYCVVHGDTVYLNPKLKR